MTMQVPDQVDFDYSIQLLPRSWWVRTLVRCATVLSKIADCPVGANRVSYSQQIMSLGEIMAASIPILETRRLTLRPLDLSDNNVVQEIFPRFEIVQFMSRTIPWPYPFDGALTFIRDVAIPNMEEGKAWHWSIRPIEAPDRLIGIISLMEEPDNNRGFWLVPDCWGRGLTTEAANVVTDYWFETLGKSALRVWKATANVQSRQISERSGMRIIASENRDYISGRLPADLWEISREEWLATRRN